MSRSLVVGVLPGRCASSFSPRLLSSPTSPLCYLIYCKHVAKTDYIMIFIIVLVYQVVIKPALAVKAQLDIIPSNSDNFGEQKTSLLCKKVIKQVGGTIGRVWGKRVLLTHKIIRCISYIHYGNDKR